MKNVRTIQLTFRALSIAAATGCLVFAMAGCNGCNSASNTPAPIVGSQDAANINGADPADQNFAEGASGTSQPTAVLGQTATYNGQQSSESYSDQQPPADQNYAYNQGDQDNGQYVDAEQAPPPLPEYDQPEAPDQNDIWTPGYWAYGNAGGYYWVPGAWVAAPYYGALWTPPYWGYYGNRYRFHHGYWGPHVGFYGGVDYGFGYIGVGYFGGYWRDHDFYYNRNVNRVPGGWGGRVYERPVVYNNVHYGMQPSIRISFNGGRGGINVRPRPFEVAAMHERHEGPVAAQMQAHTAAMQNRGQFFNQNHGRPAEAAAAHSYGNAREIRATPAGVQPGRPGGFNGNANGARPGQPMENRGAENRPGQPENRPGVNPGQQGLRGQEARPGQPGANPGMMQHNEPQNNARPNGTMQQHNEARPNPEQQHVAPQQQMHAQPEQHMQEARPQPQQRMAPQPTHTAPQQVRPQPQQQHMEQPHPQPQQHMEAPRPAAPAAPQHTEAPHAAPAPHVEAPHAAAPAPHAEAPHGGGGGEHEGGGHH